jgi:hypothetical protein
MPQEDWMMEDMFSLLMRKRMGRSARCTGRKVVIWAKETYASIKTIAKELCQSGILIHIGVGNVGII